MRETKQVLRTDLERPPGQELLIFASTWQPGFRLPLHKHLEGHEVTDVVEGEQTFEVAGVGTNIIEKVEEARMESMNWSARFGVGLAAGLVVAYVDNLAFVGEVSPIVIVVMLVAIAATAAAIWGRHGWITAGGAWMPVPLAHLVKHVLDLPDSLHPNTYASIVTLAAFTLVVTMLATGVGMLIHRGAARSSHGMSGSP